MTVNDVYELIIEYLVQGYPVTLVHYNLPNYRANKHNDEFNRMCIEIREEAVIRWDDFEGGHGTACWDHVEVFDKYDCR